MDLNHRTLAASTEDVQVLTGTSHKEHAYAHVYYPGDMNQDLNQYHAATRKCRSSWKDTEEKSGVRCHQVKSRNS